MWRKFNTIACFNGIFMRFFDMNSAGVSVRQVSDLCWGRPREKQSNQYVGHVINFYLSGRHLLPHVTKTHGKPMHITGKPLYNMIIFLQNNHKAHWIAHLRCVFGVCVCVWWWWAMEKAKWVPGPYLAISVTIHEWISCVTRRFENLISEPNS